MTPFARFALRGLTAAVLLLAALVLLQRTDRHRDLSAGQKLVQMERDRDRITLVAVGSSRTKFHLMPSVLDSVLAARGHPAYSFNYGLLGTPATEVSFSADQVLRADLPRLETMLIELQPMPLRELHWHPLTRKGAYHFDLDRVALGLRATRASDLAPAEKRAAYGRFLRLGVRHYLVAGQGTNVIRSWSARGLGARQTKDNRGFSPLTQDQPATEDQVERVYAKYTALLDSLEHRAVTVPTPVDSVLADHFLGLRERAAEQGIEVLFVVQPMTSGVEGLALLLSESDAPTLRLNDPTRHPDLYDPDLWYDGSHLNENGARRVTETAARVMAEAMTRAEVPNS